MPEKTDRRTCLRWDYVFPVLVESPVLGYLNCIARNVSCGGLFIETPAPLPLGTPLRIYFSLPDTMQGFSAAGQVKNHYFLNYSTSKGLATTTGMGIRFTQFDNNGDNHLRETLAQVRPLH